MDKEYGYLLHGTGKGPFRTECVAIKYIAPFTYYAYFEGKWRKVFYRANKPLFIKCNGEKIYIQIN